MILIADSSALIALAICDSLSLLELLYNKVKVPRAVFDEVSRKSKKEADKLNHYLENKIVEVNNTNHIIIKDGTLELGELEAMALYKQINADRLLIDDKRARKIADLNQIKVIGSLGILLLAKEQKLILEIKSKVVKIQESDIFLSEDIIEKVLKLANEN
ncbi:MAG: DUF3368 domain-containing protein [Leptospiraceae bacterium]|nr:DUF3368 domain-containing protein [Leptospiraceae bacterium]